VSGRWRVLGVVAFVLVTSHAVHAQTNVQLWANVTFDWLKSDRATYSLDLEPKVLVVPQPGRFHFRSRSLSTVVRERGIRSERPPKRRLVVRDWMRVEWRTRLPPRRPVAVRDALHLVAVARHDRAAIHDGLPTASTFA